MPLASIYVTAIKVLWLFLAVGTPALKLNAQSKGLAAALNSPSTFQSQLQPCPASCGDLGPKDWTVYTSLDRLSYCSAPILFDFAIHTPLDDSSKTVKLRVCTAGAEDKNTTSGVSTGIVRRQTESPSYSQSRIQTSLVTLKVTHENTSSAGKNTSVHLDTALTYLQSYLQTAPDLTKEIILAYYKGSVVGAYVGQAFGKATAPSAIDQILAQVRAGRETFSLTQLCGIKRDRDHVFGVAVSSRADMATVQAALISWSKGECATGPGIDSSVANFKIWEVPQRVVGNSTRPSNSTAHTQRLMPRDSAYCTTRQVGGGDTCWSLANACGISLTEFYQYNDQSICSSLQLGQKVCCTAGSLTPLPYTNGTCYTYMTQPDDNCYAISQVWSLTQVQIAEFNDGTTWGWNGCGDLGVGLNICLSTGNPPMPAVMADAVCGPQVPGTVVDGSITDASELANLNPCPLNSCCNIWGHCGIDADFCTVSKGPTGNPGTSQPNIFGCISNCGTNITNNAEGPSDGYKRVGYYESFNWDRDCLHMRAAWSNTLDYTHMHWAFASVGEDMSVYVEDSHSQWDGFMSLSQVKRIVSFGGWGFSTNYTTYEILRSAMGPDNRDLFVTNIVDFVEKTEVDGVDIDWEYPGAPDIPGIPPGLSSDAPNYLATLAALRAALPKGKSLSIAAPASYWYLKAFPISSMADIVDYIVFMAYDLHGQWDYGNVNAQAGCDTGNCLRSHVNQTEVINTLAMITKAGVHSNKIMVGESSYGRSFHMAAAGCTGPECRFTGTNSTSDAKPGRCTKTGGYLANAEINEIIAAGNGSIEIWYDDITASDYLVYDQLEWVAYMSNDTKQARRDSWEKLNFAGTIDWAVDLQEFNAADTLGATGDYDENSQISVFDNMIWEWANPFIAAVVGYTNLLQASPLPTPVTRTAYTTLTLVSGGSLNTKVVSTAFAISEVNYQPFTIGSTDTANGTILTYKPVPRITPRPMAVTIPQGWTVTSPGGSVETAATTTTVIGVPSSTTTSTTTTTDVGFIMFITWSPTVGYDLPSWVTPKPIAPTIIPDDDNSPTPLPTVEAIDCADASCTVGQDCDGDDCIRGGDCTGLNCTRGGNCTGPKCVRGGGCVGEQCQQGGDCTGDGCDTGGGCSGSSCHRGGDCSGSHCTGGGGCITSLLTKCSPGGCIGPGCGINIHCKNCINQITISVQAGGGTNPTPKPKPTCLTGCPTMTPCTNGDTACNEPCNLSRCPPDRMPTESACTTLATASVCTEFISSTAVENSPVTSYSTTTRTRCDQTMDCDVQDITYTTTITTSQEPGPEVTPEAVLDYFDDTVVDVDLMASISAVYDDWESNTDIPPPSTTSTTIEFTSTSTTSLPVATAATGCGEFMNTDFVCWSKCDLTTGQPVGGDWVEGDPRCWLSYNDQGLFCDTVADCPSTFECQPTTWESGGCHQTIVSSGCKVMLGTDSVCWSKCDPSTGLTVDTEYIDGDPWCWLMDDTGGIFCTSTSDCPTARVCQDSTYTYGGCSTNAKGS